MADAAIHISLVEIYYVISGDIYCNLHFCVYLCKDSELYKVHEIFFIFIEQKKHWCYKIKFYLVNTKMNFIDIVNLRSNKR